MENIGKMSKSLAHLSKKALEKWQIFVTAHVTHHECADTARNVKVWLRCGSADH